LCGHDFFASSVSIVAVVLQDSSGIAAERVNVLDYIEIDKKAAIPAEVIRDNSTKASSQFNLF
jgi:hypothetical protein